MINYKKIVLSKEDNCEIDNIYRELLMNKWQFVILDIKGKLKVLTKERSLFEIDKEQEFLKSAEEDIYYRSVIVDTNKSVSTSDLEIFYKYIKKYRNALEKKLYGGKYFFGSIAVRTTSGFITTIRGKENLDSYTWVLGVNHTEHLVEVLRNKATLNAPLLDYLFSENKNVKVIVHLNNEFDNNLPTLDYAFPGTVRDSLRGVFQSFNIRHHGVFYFFDEKEQQL